MLKPYFFILVLLLIFSSALNSQPISTERYFEEETVSGFTQEVACERSRVIQEYNEQFLGTAVSTDELSWTGNVDNCEEGEISELALNRTRDRINYFRKLVGIENGIHFSEDKNSKCQKAALMMDAENMLDHYPTMDWMCASEDGIQAAGKSNISYGGHSSASVVQYIRDAGTHNGAVGHRRWILYPKAHEFGFGSTTWSTAMWVIGGNQNPESYPDYVAYPSPGYFPKPLVYPRWSFTKKGAKFQDTKVYMEDEHGNSINLVLEEVVNGYGDHTIVWQPEINLHDNTRGTDHYFKVSVDSIKVGSDYISESYEVLAIVMENQDPDVSIIMPTCDDDSGSITLETQRGFKEVLWSTGEIDKTKITDLSAGEYSVTITDKLGCTQEMNFILENENEAPTLVNIIGDLSSTSGAMETYSVEQFENGDYTWTVEGGLIQSGEASNEIVVEWNSDAQNGRICVAFTDSHGCSSSEICTEIALQVSSVHTLDLSSFTIAPNPTSALIFLNSAEAIQTCTLLSLDGTIVLNQNVGFEHSVTLDLSPYSSGIYLLRTSGESGTSVQKVIKQ